MNNSEILYTHQKPYNEPGKKGHTCRQYYQRKARKHSAYNVSCSCSWSPLGGDKSQPRGLHKVDIRVNAPKSCYVSVAVDWKTYLWNFIDVTKNVYKAFLAGSLSISVWSQVDFGETVCRTLSTSSIDHIYDNVTKNAIHSVSFWIHF